MARYYRKVEIATWIDDRFRSLSSAPANGQTLWLYLLTGPRTIALPGIVIGREAVLADDLGWTVEAFREAFGEASREALVEADWKAGLILLKRALFDGSGEPRETSKPESPNVIRHWEKSWDMVPECGLKAEYLSQLGSFCEALGEAYAKAFTEAFRKALAKASSNQVTGNREQVTGKTLQLKLQGSGDSKREKKPRDPKEPSGDHQRVVAAFDSYYRDTHGGETPTWNKTTGGIVKTLLESRDADSLIARIEFLRTPPRTLWPAAPWDLKTFAAHHDKCVSAVANAEYTPGLV